MLFIFVFENSFGITIHFIRKLGIKQRKIKSGSTQDVDLNLALGSSSFNRDFFSLTKDFSLKHVNQCYRTSPFPWMAKATIARNYGFSFLFFLRC